MNLTTATPVEIDTVIADTIGPKIAGAKGKLAAARREARRYLNAGARYAVIAERHEAAAEAAELELEAAYAELRPFDEEFARRGGWTRAYIVFGGHVHRSTACSTCYDSTRFGWLPMLSGHDEAEIVDEAGERACTVCYPSAPVESLSRPSRLFHVDEVAAQAAKDERAAAKAAKDAKKAAKALGVTIGYVSTISSAKSHLTDVVCYGYRRDGEAAQIAEALARRTETTVETVWAEAAKRAAKRR